MVWLFRLLNHGTSARPPVVSGTSARLTYVGVIEAWPSRRERWLMGVPCINRWRA